MTEREGTPKALIPNFISIIIPHFNRSALLAEAVASVRNCMNCKYEIIVVDDDSAETEWRKVALMSETGLRVLQRKDGLKGPSRCRNLGIAEAIGEYVIFLDSDDWVAPWCLENRLAAIQAQPDADLVVFPVLLFKERPGDQDILWNSLDDSFSDVERFARSDPPWHTSSPIWKTDSLRKLGGFNEAVFYGDDSDLHMRALATGLTGVKQTDAVPDIFIRRSDAPRITNSLSSSLIESRRTRLREGVRFLASSNNHLSLLGIWQGQYLVEAEFLLFNHEPPNGPVSQVLVDWKIDASPPLFHYLIVFAYLNIALATRKRAYLLLRIARRIAMSLLPEWYFPKGGGFHKAKASHVRLLEPL